MAVWNQESFGLRLRAVLKLRGRTQSEVAVALRVADATVSRWGSNPDNVPSLHIIAALATWLRVSPCWLGFGCRHCVPPDVERFLRALRRLKK